MSQVAENNKRILKNTVMLYIRMFLILGISLYTSRIILKHLGVEDFGIYNVVGGIVAMMGIVKSVMSTSTSRYLNFALGKGDSSLLNKSFSVSFVIYVILAFVFIILSETVGLWFLNTKLIIPPERLFAANVVYQFCILSGANSLMSTPYNALIISHERMNIFAYIGICEAVLKLLVASTLRVVLGDKLIIYGFLLLCSDMIVFTSYLFYCRKNFTESHLRVYRDRGFYKEILSYSSWNLLGQLASLSKGQGLNVLLNMFFNPSVNASRGIAYQVNGSICNFTNNFFTAVKPQITKYYAMGDHDNFIKLIFRSSKLLYFLMLVLALPIAIEAPAIIHLWLGQMPEYVVEFVRYIIIISALDSMQHPIKAAVQATGRVALYEVIIGLLGILNIPISYWFLYKGFSPLVVFQVSLTLNFIALFVRLYLLERLVEFPILRYVKDVFMVCLATTVIAISLPVYLYSNLADSISNSIWVLISSFVLSIISILLIGLNKSERSVIMVTSQQIIKKIKIT